VSGLAIYLLFSFHYFNDALLRVYDGVMQENTQKNYKKMLFRMWGPLILREPCWSNSLNSPKFGLDNRRTDMQQSKNGHELVVL